MFENLMKSMQGEMREANPPTQSSSDNPTRDNYEEKWSKEKGQQMIYLIYFS